MKIIFFGKDKTDIVEQFSINEETLLKIQEVALQKDEDALQKLFSNIKDNEKNVHNIDMNKIIGFEIDMSAN